MAGRKRAVLPGRPEDAVPEGGAVRGYSKLSRVDLVCAGVPCQDVSVAGKRAGLVDKQTGLATGRTGLFYEFARLLRELRPTWFVFENVPGLLSSNDGRDFAEIQRVLMVECRYGICWRILDSRFFGVAQRRRRLFVVGYLGKPCPAEILFELSGGEGNTSPSGEARENVAGTLTKGVGNVGNEARGNNSGGNDGGFRTEPGEHIVIQDARGVRNKQQNGIGISEGGPCYTLDGTSQHAIAFAENQRGEVTENMRNRSQGPANYVGAETDPDRVRDTSGVSEGLDDSLPEGMDSARYRALGNAVTASVAEWIGRRIVKYVESHP